MFTKNNEDRQRPKTEALGIGAALPATNTIETVARRNYWCKSNISTFETQLGGYEKKPILWRIRWLFRVIPIAEGVLF